MIQTSHKLLSSNIHSHFSYLQLYLQRIEPLVVQAKTLNQNKVPFE